MKVSTKVLGLTALLTLFATVLTGCGSDEQAGIPETPTMEGTAEEVGMGAKGLVGAAGGLVADVVGSTKEMATNTIDSVKETVEGMAQDAMSSAENTITAKVSDLMPDVMKDSTITDMMKDSTITDMTKDSAIESVETAAEDAAIEKMSDAMSGMMNK